MCHLQKNVSPDQLAHSRYYTVRSSVKYDSVALGSERADAHSNLYLYCPHMEGDKCRSSQVNDWESIIKISQDLC